MIFLTYNCWFSSLALQELGVTIVTLKYHMRGLIEQYYLPHKNGRKRMPVIHNAIGKRDLFSWHKRIYYVGSHNCFQKANWFAKNSFLHSFKQYQKFTDRFILSNTLTVPCYAHFHSGQTRVSSSY